MVTLGIPPKTNEAFESISMRECIDILCSKMLHGIDGRDPKTQPKILIKSTSYGSDKFFRF